MNFDRLILRTIDSDWRFEKYTEMQALLLTSISTFSNMDLHLTQEHAVVHLHTRQLHSAYKFDAFKEDIPY